MEGEAPGHAHQSRVRVSGSMDTTIEDMARFAAALVRGDRLSPRMRRELTRPQLAITTSSQFPTLQSEAAPAQRYRTLEAETSTAIVVSTLAFVFTAPLWLALLHALG